MANDGLKQCQSCSMKPVGLAIPAQGRCALCVQFIWLNRSEATCRGMTKIAGASRCEKAFSKTDCCVSHWKWPSLADFKELHFAFSLDGFDPSSPVHVGAGSLVLRMGVPQLLPFGYCFPVMQLPKAHLVTYLFACTGLLKIYLHQLSPVS